MTGGLEVLPVHGLPEVAPGDDLARLILEAAPLQDGDVVVVAQKIVSKAEGALVSPRDGEPVEEARRRIAREIATEIVADAPWALIVRTRHGLVCANAGIDASNVPGGQLALLPTDPDASAARLRAALRRGGADVAVIVADTFGRPWRVGQTDVAIGVAGLRPLRDERGATDREGQTLAVTESAVADALAGAADLVRTKGGGVPVVIIRGFVHERDDTATARDLVRDPATDLFRRGSGMLAAALGGPGAPAPLPALTAGDLDRARLAVPGLEVLDAGPPTRLVAGDDFHTGVLAGVLADLGCRVSWQRDPDRVILAAGRPPAPR